MKSKKNPTTTISHHIERTDDYAWIKNIKDPDLIPLLESENQKTELTLQHTQPLQEKIFGEMISRILEDDEEHPYPRGDYEYFYKTLKGKNYPIYCRSKKGSSTPEILLDVNEKSHGKDFIHLASYRISPDQTKIAYALDFNGSEKYDLFIQDIATNTIVDSNVKAITGDFEWGNNESIFYSCLDSTHRPDRVLIHKLGDLSDHDQLIYEDQNLSYYVEISKSKSERFVWITSASKITTEVSYIDLFGPMDKVHLFTPRQAGIKYDVDHHDDRFIIRTNEHAENFKLMQAPLSNHHKDLWTDLIAYDHSRCIEEIEIFKDYIVIAERFNGLQTFRILDCKNQHIVSVEFDEPVYSVALDHNHVYDTNIVRYTYSSLKTPLQTKIYDLHTHQHKILKDRIIPGYHPNDYVTERIFALSRDQKTQIPISIIYKNGFDKNGRSPCFLSGYGSYGISRNPSFSPSIFSLLDRGFVYAIAHIRGGGDCGRSWYNDGKLLKKENTFFDFIDCAKFLIEKKFTQAGKISICGGSAGGLLMGAVTNLEPSLWGAVVALVPFVDVVNTMQDESLPLTVTEYDEWGNPNDPVFFKYMLSYSPYDNIQTKVYPPILATGGLHDPRVGYWEPTKWVFKLRDHQQGLAPILLKMQMGAGHQGPSGRYDSYRETAFYYSFIMDQIKS